MSTGLNRIWRATSFAASLAWFQLTAEKRRLIAAIAGVGIGGADGTIIASDATFLRIFPSRQPGVVEMGLIRLQPNADPEAVRAALERSLPNDVEVITHAELIRREKNYWDVNTPIGFVMLMTLVICFVVGSVILYQILYTDVTDHLAEFATLKAMGYANGHLFLVVLFQAVILAMLAYPLAWALSVGAYAITPFRDPWPCRDCAPPIRLRCFSHQTSFSASLQASRRLSVKATPL